MADDVTENLFRLRDRDGIALAARRWNIGANPRAIMVVAHGMGEHSARYRAPLASLILDGIAVYALDHRGHGASVPAGGVFGDFGPGGYAGVVSDVAALVEQTRSEHPGLPIILFGHSMGSMIAQGYALGSSNRIDGLVLCGSAAVDVVAAAGAPDPALFAAMNAPFEPGRTGFEWLSRDDSEVDTYVADPWCGFALTPESFGDLFSQGGWLANPANLARIRADLPLYIISGDHDPLNLMLHAVQPLIDRYVAHGLPVTAKLYPDARHELLNETNRAEVVSDLAGWIAGVIR